MNVSVGYILAGGRSRRMGRDKAGLEFRGKTFLTRAEEVLRPVTKQLFVVAGPDLACKDLPCISDFIPGMGPLGGVWTALEHTTARGIWILGCDLPLMQTGLFERLEEKTLHYDLVYPVGRKGIVHPLSGFYSRNCLPTVRRLVDQKRNRMRDLLNRAEIRCRPVTYQEHGFPDEIFTNVNTPEDLARLNCEMIEPRRADCVRRWRDSGK